MSRSKRLQVFGGALKKKPRLHLGKTIQKAQKWIGFCIRCRQSRLNAKALKQWQERKNIHKQPVEVIKPEFV